MLITPEISVLPLRWCFSSSFLDHETTDTWGYLSLSWGAILSVMGRWAVWGQEVSVTSPYFNRQRRLTGGKTIKKVSSCPETVRPPSASTRSQGGGPCDRARTPADAAYSAGSGAASAPTGGRAWGALLALDSLLVILRPLDEKSDLLCLIWQVWVC